MYNILIDYEYKKNESTCNVYVGRLEQQSAIIVSQHCISTTALQTSDQLSCTHKFTDIQSKRENANIIYK